MRTISEIEADLKAAESERDAEWEAATEAARQRFGAAWDNKRIAERSAVWGRIVALREELEQAKEAQR